MTDIKAGDDVYFLYSQHLTRGRCLKVNKKSYKIRFTFFGNTFEKLVSKDRAAHADDKFTVVWEHNIGIEGRYYITYDEFPSNNALGSYWHQPYTYVTK